MYSIRLSRSREHSRTLLSALIFIRPMGGGPRTFPGGINKWQWKRLHEKKAMEKERKLLDQEKQLYQARIRSEIRANLAPAASASASDHLPMSSNDHVKSLADRFVKNGAEDLWNEDDGPLKCAQPQLQSNDDSDSSLKRHQGNFRSFVRSTADGTRFRNYSSLNLGILKLNNVFGRRCYSVRPGRRFRRNDSSCSDDDSDYGAVQDVAPKKVSECTGGGEVDMMLGGRGSLGKYDVKFSKRRYSPKEMEEMAFSMPIEMIKNELEKKKLMESEAQGTDLEPLLSAKRLVFGNEIEK